MLLAESNKSFGIWLTSKFGEFLKFDDFDVFGLTKASRVRVQLNPKNHCVVRTQ